MMNLAAEEIRRLTRKVVELDRRLAQATMPGTVAEIDHGKRQLRLRLGETSDGRPLLSPWVRWEEAGGDALLKVHVPPKVGALMTLHSPSGTIGEGSVARWSTYTDGNAAPSTAEDTAVLKAGETELHLKETGEILIKAAQKLTVDVGGVAFTITPEELAMSKRFRAKGGTRPAHYVGGVDSDGDLAIDGNEDLLI
ncbi:phage baseplate protein [Prosthecomicrobium hirschii]|uniref:phage baseplate assembly protein V n=1 Tax=Prosthecodimorpha hirschii TaxID=665126 RepID=UPI00112CF4F2|nr:phage baseplate assembly protein V [Prosthecomicrobium hirschii]TPQ52362.1 phage baseplate protein [Prosthecomicrobium hirschii]